MYLTGLPMLTEVCHAANFVQTGVVEKLAQPVRFLDAFVKPKRVVMQGGRGAIQGGSEGGGVDCGAVTLMDVCRAGAVDNLNIKHVVHKIMKPSRIIVTILYTDKASGSSFLFLTLTTFTRSRCTAQ